jgi:hypothetical protein
MTWCWAAVSQHVADMMLSLVNLPKRHKSLRAAVLADSRQDAADFFPGQGSILIRNMVAAQC